MKAIYTLPLADPQASLEIVGGKGASLAKLAASELPVPDGFHVTTAAYREFVEANELQPAILSALEGVDLANPPSLENASKRINTLFLRAPIPPGLAGEIVETYSELPGSNPAVAVRSSATAEDLPEASFAGQQETYLNVSGPEEVLEAAVKCWASLWTARAISYRARQEIPPETVALAIVVQLLVPAEAAGVLFTADPVSGQRDRAVISASWGLGEAVVGGMVTPDAITVEKSSGKIINRQTAEKEVMVVQVDGGTAEQPIPENLQSVPVLTDESAAELTQLGIEIEKLYGMPMDIEWALADGAFAIVQARPITALPEPQIEPPTEWPMPNPKAQYMRASIVDLMPDPLSPLFETLGLPYIEKGINRLAEDLFKFPEDLLSDFMMTINGYAYQQLSFTPYQWWILVTRMVPRFPYMLRAGVPYWREIAQPRYVKTIARWEEKSLPDLKHDELLSGIYEVLDAFSHHLGALMGSTMGPSAGSETLFTNVYRRLVKQEDDPDAPAFLMGFDSIPIKSEKALYDLALWCREQENLSAYLKETPTKQIIHKLAGPVPPKGLDIKVWEEWQRRFRAYLEEYGYSIYDIDFTKPLPMDEPGPILEMLRLFISGQGRSPYERQGAYAERRERAVEEVRSRLKGIKRWAFEKTLNWAQKLAPLREDGIAEIGFGYPLLHRLLRELGRRFADAGAFEQADDIYWLKGSEVKSLVAALESGERLENMAEKVSERKALWRARKRATPPPQLPVGKKYMGFDMEGVLAGGEGGLEGNTIKGVGASPGQVTAPARVLHGPEDFDQMKPGDILVAGITTPAWTPLFAMAAGVVTDIGGPLSHGSIVAREYGIPAVLGTGIATKSIHSGQTITVDGSSGTVTITNGEGPA